jgi:hypothetical protein
MSGIAVGKSAIPNAKRETSLIRQKKDGADIDMADRSTFALVERKYPSGSISAVIAGCGM